MWDGGVKLPGNAGLSMLEAGSRAVLAQQADLVKQIPQFVPVTGPFPPQIPPLEGDLSVVMSLLISKLVISCVTTRGASSSGTVSAHPAQMLHSQLLVGTAW